jgi:glycosyltransferase involved in cell wall biosynthesis
VKKNSGNKIRTCIYMSGGDKWIAGVEYVHNIILALSRLPDEKRQQIELCLLYSRNNMARSKEIAALCDRIYYVEDYMRVSVFSRIVNAIVTRLLFPYRMGLEKFIRKNDIDIVYPSVIPPYNKYLENKLIPWIPDFQHVHLPQFFKKGNRKMRDYLFKKIAEKSKVVVLSSNDAKKDFETQFPKYVHKARVINFVSAPDENWYNCDVDAVQKKYSLPDKFFIICNQFWEHKNHLVVFNALSQLKKMNVNPIVVCTGTLKDTRNSEYVDNVLECLKVNGLNEQVFLLGLIAKEEQIALLRRSIGIIHPSLFEGWSTVVENAKAFNKHILLSNLNVHYEQKPANATYFEPHNSNELAQLIKEKWEILTPGPDLDDEVKARKHNFIMIDKFANDLHILLTSFNENE